MRSAAAQAGAAGGNVVMALQTATSLENLAVFTYETALSLPYLKTDARAIKTVAAFAMITMKQHDEHGKAFNGQAKKLGGKEQKAAKPKYTPIVMDMVPRLKAGGRSTSSRWPSPSRTPPPPRTSRTSRTSATPWSAAVRHRCRGRVQHLATLYSVQALLKGGAPELVTVKESGATDASKLPAAAGTAGVPESFKKTMLASPPAEGAVA